MVSDTKPRAWKEVCTRMDSPNVQNRPSRSGITADSRSPSGGADVAPAGRGADVEALPVRQFMWGAGIECSFLPHLNVDQYEWTQHDRFWRDDLRRVREDVGITNLRYAFPWHVLEPKRGQFDWSYADERMAEFQKLGINVLLDVMHFGTPLWLKQAAGRPGFPQATGGGGGAPGAR